MNTKWLMYEFCKLHLELYNGWTVEASHLCTRNNWGNEVPILK